MSASKRSGLVAALPRPAVTVAKKYVVDRHGYTHANISFPVRPDGRRLFGRKAPGRFGEGLLNGPGGKQEVGETIYAARVRELKDETTIIGERFKRIGMLFANQVARKGKPPSRQRVEVNLVLAWSGEPRVTNDEELIEFVWLYENEVRPEEVWTDQLQWLHYIWSGEPFTVSAEYDAEGKVDCVVIPGRIICDAAELQSELARLRGSHAYREAHPASLEARVLVAS
jgi:8-oxo-dGTP pyrophosphatase MutT (NUDIX family)